MTLERKRGVGDGGGELYDANNYDDIHDTDTLIIHSEKNPHLAPSTARKQSHD